MKKIAIYGIIIGSALAVGAGGGALGKRMFGPTDIDYTGFDPSIYDVDADALIAEVESYEGPLDIVDAFPYQDIVNYALEKYKLLDHCYSFGRGLADTIVKQDIRSCQIKNGDEYFEESLSKSSMVGVGNRMTQTGIGGDISIYSAPDSEVYIDNPVCGFNKTPRVLTSEDYKTTYGRTLDKMFIYIIHKDLVNSSSLEKTDNEYKITLNLNAEISPYFYKFQMKNISGLDKLPVFDFVKLTYTLDKDLMLKNCHVNEAYTAQFMSIPASIENNIDYYYFPNVEHAVPSLDEVFDYTVPGGK